MNPRPNVLLVVSDTLRSSHLGCYGNDLVRTPNMDSLAKEGTRFTSAFPESLPTIPVRRAIHTGRRAYPFRDYRPVKWDIVSCPGWQPMNNDEDTLAENLAGAGYQTGLTTDSFPYFAPGFNFTRGFWQWDFIRGQQQDRWRSPHRVSDDILKRYGDPAVLRRDVHSILPMHVANTAHVKEEGDTSTARTFKSGMRFLEENRDGQPFYLLVDCFDPHEPWEAPEEYYRMYGDPDYDGRRIVVVPYGPAHELDYTPEEVAFVKAQYCALVTLVDTWLGKMLKRLAELGLDDNTAVILTSDHGTNLWDNPRNVIGKPEDAMYPGVMRVPLIARLPGMDPGRTCDELVYDTDVTATIYDLAGVRPAQEIHGQSLLPLIEGKEGWQGRPYVTCRYGNSLCYVDGETWLLTNIDGKLQELYDPRSDPDCMHDLAAGSDPSIFRRAWDRLLTDAGGSFPDYRVRERTDALGRKTPE
jgi:arylsulfatase A-like enzyme